MSDPQIRKLAADITRRSIEAIMTSGELLADLAPLFVKGFQVDKVQRVITVEFYEVPAFNQLDGLKTGTRIEEMEAAAVLLNTIAEAHREGGVYTEVFVGRPAKRRTQGAVDAPGPAATVSRTWSSASRARPEPR